MGRHEKSTYQARAERGQEAVEKVGERLRGLRDRVATGFSGFLRERNVGSKAKNMLDTAAKAGFAGVGLGIDAVAGAGRMAASGMETVQSAASSAKTMARETMDSARTAAANAREKASRTAAEGRAKARNFSESISGLFERGKNGIEAAYIDAVQRKKARMAARGRRVNSINSEKVVHQEAIDESKNLRRLRKASRGLESLGDEGNAARKGIAEDATKARARQAARRRRLRYGQELGREGLRRNRTEKLTTLFVNQLDRITPALLTRKVESDSEKVEKALNSSSGETGD